MLYQARVRRDPEAFGKIYDAYVSRIYRFIYFKMQSKEEAEDLTSETFARLWKYLQEGKPVKHLGALTYQIARNLVSDHYRGQTDRMILSTDAIREEEATEPNAAAAFDTSIDAATLERSLRLLKDEYREALVLRYLDELSPKEIAVILGKNSGATRVLIHRALQALRVVMRTPSKI